MSGTCSSTSEHQTRSTSPWPSGSVPSGATQPQVGARDVAPRALERRLGELDADGLGAGVAQRGDEAPGAAAEVEHPLAGLHLAQQQRAPARATPTAPGPPAARPTRPRRTRAPESLTRRP